MLDLPKTVQWIDNELILLDQTKLPIKVCYEKQNNIHDVYNSIKELKVRGAPAIGVAGAYGLVIGAKSIINKNKINFLNDIKEIAKYLISSRPTAVNLSWAVNRVLNTALNVKANNTKNIFQAMLDEATKIHNEDIELCKNIGIFGEKLIKDGYKILTHCNAGALATTGIGTALAPIYMAYQNGKNIEVFANETRPLLQGSRLTAWELQQVGIKTTLQTDNMVAYLMSNIKVDLIITGADRVSANGDSANKIGTYSVAIQAKYFNIPFYIAAPSSTIDLKAKTAKDIIIEQRDPKEIKFFNGCQSAPKNINVINPAFDVTPASLITGIITEKGILYPPYEKAIQENFG